MRKGHRFQLELGQLFGAATVRPNANLLGAALLPLCIINLTEGLKPGDNWLEVTLRPPRKNRLAHPIENNEPGSNAPDVVDTSARVSGGLIGPVHIKESEPRGD